MFFFGEILQPQRLALLSGSLKRRVFANAKQVPLWIVRWSKLLCANNQMSS